MGAIACVRCHERASARASNQLAVRPEARAAPRGREANAWAAAAAAAKQQHALITSW